MFFLGQIPGSIFWGWFADSYGRRYAMIIISIRKPRSSFRSSQYGLSVVARSLPELLLSLAIRLLHGLIDGGLGVCKTIVADLCNDSNIMIGTGQIFVGAAIGGYISLPSPT